MYVQILLLQHALFQHIRVLFIYEGTRALPEEVRDAGWFDPIRFFSFVSSITARGTGNYCSPIDFERVSSR